MTSSYWCNIAENPKTKNPLILAEFGGFDECRFQRFDGHRPLRRPSIQYFDGIAFVRPKARAAPPAEYPAAARKV
jgi:hypothetical protein